jgi:hypothetical protein
MARGLTAGIQTEIAKRIVTVAIFAEIEFISGTTRVWSGVGDKVLGGETFTGVGDLGSISSVEETDDVKASSVELTLSGIPSTILAAAIGDSRQGKTATIWLAFLDSSLAIIADEVILFRGRTDVPTIMEGGETSIMSMRVENHLLDLKRASNHRYTQEEQQETYPSDVFFEFVPSLQNKTILWQKFEKPEHSSGGGFTDWEWGG